MGNGLPQTRPTDYGAAIAWCLGFALTAAVVADATTGADGTPPPDPPGVLQTLRDPQVPFEDRVDLATALLNHQDEQTAIWLNRALQDPEAAASHRVILRALLNRPPQDLSPFEDALFELLAAEDEQLTPMVVQALGRIEAPDTVPRLIAVAENRGARLAHRRAAIGTLAYHPERDVVETLMGLTADDEASVHPAVYGALRQLTGQHDWPDDPTPWWSWWRLREGLSALDWQRAMTRDHAARGRRAAARQAQLATRLSDALRLHYLGADADRRTELLIAWLEDPLPTIRVMAMDLVAQRLVDVGAAPVREPLRVALRHRLDADAPAMRRRAADALRQLSDAPAAKLVAATLAADSEQDAEVLTAYLRLVRQVPQRAAVAPLIRLLGHPPVTRVAADALTAALDVDDQDPPWITPAQATTVRDIARRHLAVVNDETPSMIRLLGRLADPHTDGDWQLIAAFLDSDVDRVKDAAARAWAESLQPVTPLSRRADDGVIQPFLYDAANRRGNDVTFRALADHPPDASTLLANWEQAMIALAGRIRAPSVLAVNAVLAEDDARQALRVNLLSAAVRRAESAVTEGAAPADRRALVGLLLARADALSDAGQPRRALPDYQRVRDDADLGADAAQRGRARHGTFRALLATADIPAALEVAQRILTGDGSGAAGDPVDAVLPPLIDAALRSVETENPADARSIHTFLTSRVEARRRAPYAAAIERIEAELRTRPDTDNAVDANGGGAAAPARDG